MKTTNKSICNSAKVKKNPLRDEFYTTAETAELQAKGKLNKDDATGEMEVGYLRHVPIDLEGTCLAPITCLLSSKFKEKYEVLGLCQTMVTVNGKNRFFRIRVRRKTADEQLDSIDA